MVAASLAETENACLEAGGYSLRAVPVNEAGTEHHLGMFPEWISFGQRCFIGGLNRVYHW